ncbi:hypothetical protein H4R33_002943 [Dimargaris cristalligena]|nr:hypothetical protein H4R33_002943 [Dimargaris cristalligena]
MATDPVTLCDWCVKILHTPDPFTKVKLTQELNQLWTSGQITKIGEGVAPERPGRPDDLEFVAPGKAIRLGKAGSMQSRIAILHSLSNIEQWAIDTALDNIVRFKSSNPPRGDQPNPSGEDCLMPRSFFDDFVRMAAEEAKHFLWLTARLADLGSHFGALPVHAGIWESAAETAHDVACRMVIVHMVHEARGLDVNPNTIQNFRKAGDTTTADMLDVILADEVTHVETGHRWFDYMCRQRGKDKQEVFRVTVQKHFRGVLKPPFNEEARRAAGMEPELYQNLDTKESATNV